MTGHLEHGDEEHNRKESRGEIHRGNSRILHQVSNIPIACYKTIKIQIESCANTHHENVKTNFHFDRCTAADNHAVREAACQCIAELAAKIDREILKPYVNTLLDTLLV